MTDADVDETLRRLDDNRFDRSLGVKPKHRIEPEALARAHGAGRLSRDEIVTHLGQGQAKHVARHINALEANGCHATADHIAQRHPKALQHVESVRVLQAAIDRAANSRRDPMQLANDLHYALLAPAAGPLVGRLGRDPRSVLRRAVAQAADGAILDELTQDKDPAVANDAWANLAQRRPGQLLDRFATAREGSLVDEHAEAAYRIMGSADYLRDHLAVARRLARLHATQLLGEPTLAQVAVAITFFDTAIKAIGNTALRQGNADVFLRVANRSFQSEQFQRYRMTLSFDRLGQPGVHVET